MDTHPDTDFTALQQSSPADTVEKVACDVDPVPEVHPVTEAIEDKLVAECDRIPNGAVTVNAIAPTPSSALPDIDDEPMVMPERIMGIDVDPAARLIPGPSRKQFQDLTKDIDAQGLLHPVARFRGRWLDGRLRLMACEALGIIPTLIDLPDDTDPVAYVVSANARRRHLSKSQIAMAVAAAREWAKSGSNQHSGGGEPGSTPATNESMADEAGVSVKTIQQAKIVYQAGLEQEVMSGQKTLKQAVEAAKNIRSDDLGEKEGRNNDRPSNKKPKRKLPEDVLELQRQLRDREDEIDELSMALEREQATTKKLKADCDQLKRENAALKSKAMTNVRDWIEATVVDEPELEEVVEALAAVDETPVDVAMIDDVAPEEAAVEHAAVDVADQDYDPTEALLRPPSPLAVHAEELRGACRRSPKNADQYDKQTREYGLYSDAEDILEIEGRLQCGDEVSDIDLAAYCAYQEHHGLSAAAAGRVVAQDQASTLAMLHEAEDLVSVRLRVASSTVATPLPEASVAAKLPAPALESSVRVTEEAIDFAAYLGHTVVLVEGLETAAAAVS